MDVTVCPGTVAELPAVLNVLDGAALETDHDQIRDRLASDDVLVAVSPEDFGQILGACVLVEGEIRAIAVRLRHRDRGIGRALVTYAAANHDRLVAAFDRDVRPFYAALGFDIRPIADGRYEGVLESDPDP
ncbi:MAG: GNAT family N-acetyltransferase [Halorhabdus sp.]